MTSYEISLGYCAEHNDSDKLWRLLKQRARELCDHPELIAAEARRLGSPEMCNKGCCKLDEFVGAYREPFDTNTRHEGHAITVKDSVDEEERRIIQWACGADHFKFCVRRAFVRLLIEAMHRERVELNIHVY